MKNKSIVLFALLLILGGTSLFAGTGGAELQTWYQDISAALQGFWGKIIAAVFLGICIILFKGGAIVGGIFMMMLGLSVGMIPDIIDSKYTALMIENESIELIDSITYQINAFIH